MARIKYSALVTGMSGKLNGSVLARNKGGNYVRNKTTPTNPQTPWQTYYRSVFGAIASAWGQLTPTQRNEWNDFAAQTPYTDIWGDQRYLSGFAMHQKLNANLSVVFQPQLAAPVEFTAMPVFTISLDSDLANNSITVNWAAPVLPTEQDFQIVFAATPVLRPGVSFTKNLHRIISTSEELSASASYNLYTDFTERYGVPGVGDKIAVYMYVIGKETGQASVAQRADIVLADAP